MANPKKGKKSYNAKKNTYAKKPVSKQVKASPSPRKPAKAMTLKRNARASAVSKKSPYSDALNQLVNSFSGILDEIRPLIKSISQAMQEKKVKPKKKSFKVLSTAEKAFGEAPQIQGAEDSEKSQETE